MLVKKLELTVAGRTYKVEFNPVTALYGRYSTGKTLILRTLYRSLIEVDKLVKNPKNEKTTLLITVPEQLRNSIIRKFARKWNIDLSEWHGDVLIVRSSTRQDTSELVIKLDFLNTPILHVIKSVDCVNLKQPIELTLEEDIQDLKTLHDRLLRRPTTKLLSDVEQTLNIVLELVIDIVNFVRNGVDIVYIGPYVEFNTCIDLEELTKIVGSRQERHVGTHGEHTLPALLELMRDVRKYLKFVKYTGILSKFGVNGLSVGLYRNIVTFSYNYENFEPCPELSHSVKSYIAYLVQTLLVRQNSIIFIENFENCSNIELVKKLCELFQEEASRRGVQFVLEVHDETIVELLRDFNVSIITL